MPRARSSSASAGSMSSGRWYGPGSGGAAGSGGRRRVGFGLWSWGEFLHGALGHPPVLREPQDEREGTAAEGGGKGAGGDHGVLPRAAVIDYQITLTEVTHP